MRANPRNDLVIHHLSVHGLIRGHDLELGRDADTGGQTTYVVELARALGRHERVRDVVLFTRLVDDERVSDDYAAEEEPLGHGARIVRIRAGGGRYRRKETLWPHLDAFVTGVLRWYREHDVIPDVLHGHYADAGYVAHELAARLDVPLVFTGHSLGRNKRDVLERAGVSAEDIESRYHVAHRIDVEEQLLRDADKVVASTQHEVERGYALYEARDAARFLVLPPGTNVERFYPWFYDADDAFDSGDDVTAARVRMKRELDRFLTNPDKPLILAISRPDKRKNISGLVDAFGRDPELRHLANLAIFAGVRKNIESMSDNEREVLTDLLLRMDRYDLYGSLALPKRHDPDVDIPVLYRLAAERRGVFVNPALVENFGITIIEASASGLPVVSTDHGGPNEILGRCQSGALVDASDTEAIQRSLKRILTDAELWDRYSQAGIEGVREHYAWRAHVTSYLAALTPLVETAEATDDEARAPDATAWRTRVGRDLLHAGRLLVSDIDGTLVDGEPDPEAMQALHDVLETGNLAFAVASGRRLALVEDAITAFGLPEPAIIISDVGSDIRYGRERVVDHGFRRHVTRRWNPHVVREVLTTFGFEPQEDAAQTDRKVSFLLGAGTDLDAVDAALQERGVDAHLIPSAGWYLDVLPARAGKGAAIRYLAQAWGFGTTSIIAAGDSGNDRDMLLGPWFGIVVGNHHAELADLRGKRRMYMAEAPHAWGVVEGLRALRFATPR